MRLRHLLASTAACFCIVASITVRSVAETPAKAGNVTEARVVAEASEGNDWLVGGRTFDEQHFSPLKQSLIRTSQNLAWHGPPTSRAPWAWQPSP